MQDDFELIVIGSGPAGQRAAIQAAKIGRRVALVESTPSVGGVCMLTGTIPSKTLREAVLATTEADMFDRGRERTVDATMSDLLGHVQDVVRTESMVVRNQLERNDVEIIQGRAAFTDTDSVTITGRAGARTCRADRFLIATGTRPAPPEGIPVDGTVVLTSDEVFGLERIPESMTIVGGGVIGIEYASIFGRLGVDVHVVDRHERLLNFADDELVDDLVEQMTADGVHFHLPDSVAGTEIVDGPRPHAVVTLESGLEIRSDTLLYSIGRIACTADLNLPAIGIRSGRRGRLEVDEDYRTSAANVWAAGDVIGFPALATTSSEQGRIAACRMFDISVSDMGRNYPYGIYSIPEMSMVGSTEQELGEDGVPYVTGRARYREIARGQILGDDTGLLKMIFHREDGRLLGVHCIGTGATELIHVGQAVYKLGGGLDYFLETVFNYPTLAECYKVAAFDAANTLGYRHDSLETPGSFPPPGDSG